MDENTKSPCGPLEKQFEGGGEGIQNSLVDLTLLPVAGADHSVEGILGTTGMDAGFVANCDDGAVNIGHLNSSQRVSSRFPMESNLSGLSVYSRNGFAYHGFSDGKKGSEESRPEDTKFQQTDEQSLRKDFARIPTEVRSIGLEFTRSGTLPTKENIPCGCQLLDCHPVHFFKSHYIDTIIAAIFFFHQRAKGAGKAV